MSSWPVSEQLVPVMKPESVLLTLDPAAAYAGLVASRAGVHTAVAHPCHPSIFLQRTTEEEWEDTFGGIAAPQEVVAAIESDDSTTKRRGRRDPAHVRARRRRALGDRQAAGGPGTDPRRDLACMIGACSRRPWRRPSTPSASPSRPPGRCSRPRPGGAGQRPPGSNPFSDACHIAMTYGRETVIQDDWKRSSPTASSTRSSPGCCASRPSSTQSADPQAGADPGRRSGGPDVLSAPGCIMEQATRHVRCGTRTGRGPVRSNH